MTRIIDYLYLQKCVSCLYDTVKIGVKYMETTIYIYICVCVCVCVRACVRLLACACVK
jgi:hypothetical protein